MKNSILGVIVMVIQLLLAGVLIYLGIYAEENIYAPAAIDGYFYIRLLIPGICLVIGALFNLTYKKFEKKVYLAAYGALLIFAVSNTLDLSVFALNHFPINWVGQILNCLLISAITALICGFFSFIYVLVRGRAGKILIAPNDERYD